MIRQIQSLTSLRFFFCILVFSYHLKFLKTSNDIVLSGLYERYFQEVYIGVSFFFILSGFILTHNYYERLTTHKISKLTFYWGRISRIYPLYFLTFLISIPLMADILLGDPGKFLGLSFIHLSLFQSYIPFNEIYFNFNNPSWFISDEIFFYLTTPFLFLVLSKGLSIKNVFLLYLAIAAIILIGIHLTPFKLQHPLYYINPLIRIFDFIIGILLYFLFTKLYARKYSRSFITLLEVLSILLFFLFYYYHDQISQAYRFSIYYWLPLSIIVLVFALEKGYLSKLISQRQLVYLGEISFSFYMLHELIIRYYSFIFRKMLGLSGNHLMNTVIIFFITLILSILTFEFYEKRVSKILKNWRFKNLSPGI